MQRPFYQLLWKESWLLQEVTGVACEDCGAPEFQLELGGETQLMAALVPYVCEVLSLVTSICHTDLGL